MHSRTFRHLAIAVALSALAAAAPALAQSGLRLPERGEPGLDPSFARGWLAPDFDRFGFASTHWKDAAGFAPSQRMSWSYTFSNRHSLGMSLGAVREYEYERQFSLYGRYWLAPDWAVSAEATSREAASGLRVQDLRIGVQRRF
ncbi:MAG TPA: hypothetical protein VIQ55_11650 [Burkholderiales bacterium]|jgi:hypothetical protein